MIYIEILKVLLIVLLCVYVSITDIKYGIIANRILLIFLFIGLILDIIGWFLVDFSLLKKQLINILAVLIISIILYVLHIWSGGDCKLMFVISLIIPQELYISIVNEYLSLILLFAIVFGINFLYIIVDSIIFAIKKKQIITKDKFIMKTKKAFGDWICCLSYIVLFDQVIIKVFSNTVNNFQIIIFIINVLLVFVISGLNFLHNKAIVISVIIAGIVVKFILNQQIINKIMLINYSIIILFVFLRIFIDEYNCEFIETSKVRKGMILSTATTLQFVNSKVKGLPSLSTEDLRSRITEKEAESVRRWGKSKYGTSTVEIVRKIPFAIFISLGTFIFLVLGATIR